MKKITVGVLLVIMLTLIVAIYFQNRSMQSRQDSRIGATQQNKDSKAAAEKKSADEVSILSFDKKDKSVGVDEKFTLQAMMDTKGKKVSAAELHVVFNPKVLQLESVQPSDVFTLVLLGAQIDNEKGIASIVVGVPLGQKAADGSTVAASFNFKAISAGNGEVNFTDKSVAAAEGATGNVISSRAGATISVK